VGFLPADNAATAETGNMIVIFCLPLSILCLILAFLCLRIKRPRHAFICALAGVVLLGLAVLLTVGGTVLIQEITLPT
jgi:hypothetical protein